MIQLLVCECHYFITHFVHDLNLHAGRLWTNAFSSMTEWTLKRRKKDFLRNVSNCLAWKYQGVELFSDTAL